MPAATAGGALSVRVPAAAVTPAPAPAAAPSELRVETLRYRDFDTSEGMLITHDFSWEEHAYALVARCYPPGAPVLERQFKTAFNLTYSRFSATGEAVNTEPFRTAIWYYIQRLYGVRNDHYDYAMVNRCVPREARAGASVTWWRGGRRCCAALRCAALRRFAHTHARHPLRRSPSPRAAS